MSSDESFTRENERRGGDSAATTRREWREGDWIDCPRCERQTYDVGSCSLCGNLGVLDANGDRFHCDLAEPRNSSTLRQDADGADCPNRPEWTAPVPAIEPTHGWCFHCSKVAGEWVKCEADRG